MRWKPRYIIGFLILFCVQGGPVFAAEVRPASAIEAETYNRGVSLFQAGKIEEAAEHFASVSAAVDPSIAARARYNLGNVRYRQAVDALATGDPNSPADPGNSNNSGASATVIERLRSAIDHYQSSLRLDPSDDDARANIESAARLIQQLDQAQSPPEDQDGQQEEQDSEQDEESKEGDPADDSKSDESSSEGDESESDDSKNDDAERGEESGGGEDAADEQESSDDPADQSAGSGQSEPSQGDSSGSPGEEASDESSSSESPGGDPEESDSGTPSAPSANGDSSDDSGQDSSMDGRSDGESDPTSNSDSKESNADKSSDEATDSKGELTASDGDLSDAPPDDGESMARMADGAADAMTPQEAKKLLQSIRDRDMLRRLRQRAAERDRRVPVDRDW
ncbi:Tetratricopeptide repeat protein [Rubripirellula tenax]|uniref:Tetratricopeptide repeat protein n=1 Tax=Rubripirellula tenax TaxID=2528015 RepID=A0A5C6EGQ8_9BACT|nr:hypothetical protein [Rubripirellula tenax]TWU47227.1 Tetratricopeptide repeat protein [Rubripirellula tenax]